ncbi:MAG: RDD family protein [Pyrinomonadaceae bacterium]
MTARIERTTVVKTETAARAQSEVYLERMRAPFSLRCGALLIDYILLACIVVLSTLLARLFGGGARMAGNTVETVGLFIALAVFVLDFFVLTGLRGQTIGKWATGLRIERRDGEPLGLGHSLLRHAVGYPVSLLIFGLGFLWAAFNAQGRALHDVIADTIVVRDEPRRMRGK